MAKLVDRAMQRLAMYGYADGVSGELVEACISNAVQTVLGFCNLTELPSGLERVVVDLACGEVMYVLDFPAGDAAAESEQTIASVKEGDTQVTFATDATPAQRRLAQINALRAVPYDKLIPYRRLKW